MITAVKVISATTREAWIRMEPLAPKVKPNAVIVPFTKPEKPELLKVTPKFPVNPKPGTPITTLPLAVREKFKMPLIKLIFPKTFTVASPKKLRESGLDIGINMVKFPLLIPMVRLPVKLNPNTLTLRLVTEISNLSVRVSMIS